MAITLKTPWRPVGRSRRERSRRGSALVLFAVCLIPLLACVALAVDLGILTLAQTQLSDAADSAALAGARALNGDTTGGRDNNYSGVIPAAQSVLSGNVVLGAPLQTSQMNVAIGCYTYNSTNERFEGQLGTKPPADNWNLVQATVTANVSSRMGFSKIFNLTVPNLQAVATSAHRPRDICLILDYSGSMRFGSLLALPYSGSSRSSNNQDTIYPVFGHYSSSSANLLGPAPSSPYDNANISATMDGRAPIIEDFYGETTSVKAFYDKYQPASYATTPGGDNCLKTNKNGGSSYAQTVAQVLNLSSVTNSTRNADFETYGYDWSDFNPDPPTFVGRTTGPGYYGKTFFIWPPDPRATKDWRKLYFTYPSSSSVMDDNSRLWDTSGNWRAPSSTTYGINYAAILNFIKNVGPNPFPTRLQAGRILYYDAIPDTISTSSWPPSDLNQRFWKDYIDYVLGVVQTSSSSYSAITGYTGYGADFTWGTVKITAKSSLSGSPAPYMQYADNPKRPRLHFWFGPITMIDFLGNYNLWNNGTFGNNSNSRFCWWPGTCHETPLYACKLGIRAALTDINNNHPNDMVSLIMFSTPKTSASDSDADRFNRVRVGLSRDYARMNEALWYPPATVGNPSATVRPYDSQNLEVPRAMGGTCYSMGLMLAYNQFSSNASLRTYNPAEPIGDAGGNGRRGAQKIIIFESDGEPNTPISATLTGSGTCQKYYAIRYNSANPGSSEYPSSSSTDVQTQINSLCTQLAAQEGAGGYSTPSRPLLIHCIAFGPGGTAATTVLNQMQTIGNVNDGMPSYKIVDGTETEIITKLQTAIAKILQDGVQVSLIQ